MKKTYKKNSGAIALTAIIIISAVALIITTAIATFSINGSLTRMVSTRQLKLDAIVDGCLEKALIEYKKDLQGYTGSTTSDCTIQLTGVSPLITINISATLDNLTKETEAQISFEPEFQLISYREVINT